MKIQYLSWDDECFNDNLDLQFVDAITVHYKNGDILIYNQNDISVQLMSKLQSSSFTFIAINYKAGLTTILYPSGASTPKKFTSSYL